MGNFQGRGRDSGAKEYRAGVRAGEEKSPRRRRRRRAFTEVIIARGGDNILCSRQALSVRRYGVHGAAAVCICNRYVDSPSRTV